MNREETVKVLTMVSALDGRAADDMQVEMWREMFRNYSFDQVKDAIIPAYKESDKGFLSAKAVWDVVRREAAQPKARAWVRELHDIGEHFECTKEECFRWSQEDIAKGLPE